MFRVFITPRERKFIDYATIQGQQLRIFQGVRYYTEAPSVATI